MNRMGLWTVAMAMMMGVTLATVDRVQADEMPTLGEQMSQKFMRGVVNLSTGWVEIPRQIYVVGANEGWVRGVLRGPFDGIGMFFARTVAGAVEVATFPVPLPTYQPMITPTYAWESEQVSDMMAVCSQ